MLGGSAGATHTWPWGAQGSSRSRSRRIRCGAAAAHACGLHDVGYATGADISEREKPANSSRSLPPPASAAARSRVTEAYDEHDADPVVLCWSQDSSLGHAAVVRDVCTVSTIPVLLLPVTRDA